jgi:hypothetical protein
MIFSMDSPARVHGLHGSDVPDDSVNAGPPITIKYTLTRMEIVGSFLRSIPKSPRTLLVVVGSSLLAGAISLAASGAALRTHSGGAILNACGLALGVFCFFVFMVFVQARTQERTLRVSPLGIATWIGTRSANIPWTKITTVKSVGRHLLIVRSTGNSFLIPMRAFRDTDQCTEFVEVTRSWLEASR